MAAWIAIAVPAKTAPRPPATDALCMGTVTARPLVRQRGQMNNFHDTTAPPANDSQHGCQQALARLLPVTLYAQLRARFPEILRERRHMLHLAMIEAAALAGQTAYPQLFFPALAWEKAELLAAWNQRQQNLRRAVSPPRPSRVCVHRPFTRVHTILRGNASARGRQGRA